MPAGANNFDDLERAIASNRARLKSSRRTLAGMERRLKPEGRSSGEKPSEKR
jgi:hypothetical protein